MSAGPDRLLADLEALAEGFVSEIDWSDGRNHYGDNEAWEAAARRVREVIAAHTPDAATDPAPGLQAGGDAASGECVGCPPCPGRGSDGHGMTHCAECCFGTGVEADPSCPVHGDPEPDAGDVEALGDHPYVDPRDGRQECYLCGKFVHDVTHSCKGVPVTRAAEARVRLLIDAARAQGAAEALRDAAHAWQTGEWTVLTEPIKAPEQPQRIIGASQAVTDWLRERADRIERDGEGR